jgi:hypothetical protein
LFEQDFDKAGLPPGHQDPRRQSSKSVPLTSNELIKREENKKKAQLDAKNKQLVKRKERAAKKASQSVAVPTVPSPDVPC